jgi:acyl-CoA synthetase (NDP forming)
MARTVTVRLIDDLDHESAADETVTFTLDGVKYEIDLSAVNAKQLRVNLQPWIDASRRVGGQKRRLAHSGSVAGADRALNAAIRTWARRSGLVVPTRGRLPRSLINAYQASA